MKKSAVPLLSRVFGSVFGKVNWSPPPWPGWLAGRVRRHRQAIGIAIVVVGSAGWGGWKWWQRRESERLQKLAWEEAHRARKDATGPVIRDVTAVIAGPGNPVPDSSIPHTFQPSPVVLEFSLSSAPMVSAPAEAKTAAPDASTPKPAAGAVKEITMIPATEGTWKWETETRLVFRPAKPWPAEESYSVLLSDKVELNPGVRLGKRNYFFKSAPFTANLPSVVFYTDPANPAIHQVVAEVTFSHPVKAAEVEKHIGFSVVGGTPLFAKDGKTPSPLFTLVPDDGDAQRHFWARSAALTIPPKEDFVVVTVQPGMVLDSGGKPMEKEAAGRAKVPDVSSGLSIAEVRGDIIANDEGEPAQYLFVRTKGFTLLETLAAGLEVKLLPPKSEEESEWQSVEELTPEVLAKSKPVKFKAEPGEEKFTEEHIFRFEPVAPGQLYIKIRKGMAGVGGFILPDDHRLMIASPEFPRELSFTGRGGLLALNGERKLTVKARKVSHIRYTLARVPAAQINHLASMTRGNFESPVFRGSFGKENITRIRTEVVKINKVNDYQAVWSSFDFTPATHSPEAAAEDSRGLFFLTAEAVHPRKKAQEEENAEESQEEEEEENDQNGNEGKEDADADWVVEKVRPVAGSNEDGDEDEDEKPRGLNTAPSRFVLITDLGLLVKENADASRDIFVQSVSKGGPVANVELNVVAKNGEVVAGARTDAEGHARFDSTGHLKKDQAPVAIVARLASDLAFMPWERHDRLLDFSRFDTAGVLASQGDALDAFLFTERGIYRPGDTVHFGIAVRPRGWKGKVEGIPVKLEIANAAGNKCFEKDLQLTADGFLECDGDLNENDPTGIYTARLLLAGDKEAVQLGRVAFRVEDFQPDRMKVTATLPGVPAKGWRTNPEVKAQVEVRTLFGFPAAERRVTGKLVVGPGSFSFPEFPGYGFNAHDSKEYEDVNNRKELSLGEVQSGETGKAEFSLGLERFAGASVSYTFFAEAFEADGGRSVAARASGIYSPLERIVGFKADGDLGYIGQDAPRAIQLMCINPEVKAIAATDLTVQISEVRNVSVLTRQKSGSYAYTSTEKVTPVLEKPLDLPAGGSGFPLPVNKTGRYKLVVLDPAKNGLCTVWFNVVGKGNSGRSLEQNAELEMELAREEWKGGEMLECSLRAPFTGSGLLTIEREKVLAWQWFRSAATDTVQKIRVPDALEGSAYVNASFVRALDSPEVFMSPLSYAVEPFRANMDRHRTEVQLDCPPVVVPGAKMKIGVRSAVPCRTIVFAVDEGIHQITNYKLPQPLDFFLRKRGLEVQTFQILDLILPEFTVLGRSRAFGGGDGEDDAVNVTLNPFKRRKEAPVVYWSGVVATGPQRMELEYHVPDYFAGQFTIMAVAAGGSQMASSQTKTLVRGPFVLTPNAPLFAAPGDTFTASLTVANNNDAGGAAGEQIRSTLKASENLEVVAVPNAPLAIPRGKEGTVRFQVRAREPLGNATLTFRAEAAGASAERSVTLTIRPVSPRMTTVQSGWFRTPEHQVKTTRLMHNEFAERESSVSALPLSLAKGLEKWLHAFPHGCTEQLVSRALARTILSSEAAFGFDRAEATKDLAAVFTTLRTRQAPDGGFGPWGRSGSGGIESLTPYVAQFLTESKEAGFAVPPDLLAGSLKRLRVMAADHPRDARQQAIVARAIYLLTRNGEVTTNYLLNLRDVMDKEMKDKWQTDNAVPWMASTYALLKKTEEAMKLITPWQEARHRAALAKLPMPGWNYYDEQPLATEAQGLMLLSRHFPDVAGKLDYEDLRPITQGLERAEYNTYSAASCVFAFKAWSGLQKNSGVYTSLHEVAAGVEPRMLSPVGVGLVSADFTAAAQAIKFGIIRPDGAPDMGAYYQIVESGFDRGLPAEAVKDGLEVSRSFVDPNNKSLSELKVGEDAFVILSVRNLSGKTQPDIALVDLLPCGFEVGADSLRPGPQGAPGADSVDVREDRNIFYCTVGERNTLTFRYKVKPVCAGEFHVPPASASSMYDQAIHARGVASTIKVASRE